MYVCIYMHMYVRMYVCIGYMYVRMYVCMYALARSSSDISLAAASHEGLATCRKMVSRS